jgi:hypothetical protein
LTSLMTQRIKLASLISVGFSVAQANKLEWDRVDETGDLSTYCKAGGTSDGWIHLFFFLRKSGGGSPLPNANFY